MLKSFQVKCLKLLTLLLLIWFVSITSAQSTVKCCTWYFDATWPDPYAYWHELGDAYYAYRFCYDCGPYSTRCYYYKWQNGYWSVNVGYEANCSYCSTLATCDHAIYRACATVPIHNGVIRLINGTRPGGNLPQGCSSYYQCTSADRWIQLWSDCSCNNF